MSKWFKKTMSTITSLGSKKKSDDEGKQSANEFKQMVSNIKKGVEKHDCVFFFLEHLVRKPIEDLRSYKMEKEVALLTRKYAKIVAQNVNDLATLGESLVFFNVAIKIFTPDQKTSKNLLKLICAIMDTNNVDILDLSSDFIHACIEDNQFLNYMFQGESLSQIWSSCFLGHDNTSSFYASVLLAAASNYEFKNLESIEPLLSVVRSTFKDSLITPQNLPNSLTFVGYVIHMINTGTFISDILPFVVEVAPMLSTLQFFENLLCSPSDAPEETWEALSKIISDAAISSVVVKSAVIAINNSNCTPPEQFSLTPFIRSIKDFPESIKKMFYGILEKSSHYAKCDFFCNSSPLKETKVDTGVLASIVTQEEWDEDVEQMLSSFFLVSEPTVLLEFLKEDQNVFVIATTLLDQLPQESNAAVGLFARFMGYAIEGCEIVMPLINKITQRISSQLYMESLIGFIDNGVPPFVFNGLIGTIRKIDNWAETFRSYGGCKLIGKIVESIEGINFLAVLANSGPIVEIDDFIQKNFDKCALKDQTNDTLTKLMLGIPQDSTRPGYIRIPSLCAHVDPVPCATPFDQFIFATMGPHLMKMEKSHLASVVGRIISSQQVSLVCDDPALLTAATSPDLPHTSLYQFHTAAKNATANAKLTTSISFWVYVAEFLGKSIIASLDNENNLLLLQNGVKVFNQDEVHPFTLRQWHMISIIKSDKVNKKTVIYIDNELITTIPKNFDTITFGSSSESNSIWYLSTTIHSSSNVFNSETISDLYEQGYNVAAPYDINLDSGAKFVPYRGVVKYIHALGGPDFIFLRLIKCESNDDFLLYLQCAFNLLALKQIQVREFFSSIRYILMRRPEMYTKQVETIIMYEFANKEGLKWNYICNLFCDFCFLAQLNISLDSIANSITESSATAESVPLIHYAMDTYVFFELNQVAEANFFLLLEAYISSQPWLLKKIALFIVGIPFCDSDDIESFYDEKRIAKQKKLLNIITRDQAIFIANVPSQLAFTIVPLLNTELALKLFSFLADICCQEPDYFDFRDFKLTKPFVRMNASSRDVWVILFTFLTEKRASKIEEFLSYDVKRPEIYSFLLSLVCDLLPVDISKGSSGDCLSFTILHLLYSFAMTQQLHFSSMVKEVQRLCTFGFDERDLVPQQFVIDDEVKEVPTSINRRKSFTESFRRSIGGGGEKTPLIGMLIGADLDQQLFNKTKKHLKSCTFNDDLVEPPKIIYPEVPDNFEELVNPGNEKQNDICDLADLVVVIASKTLIESAGDVSLFKKALVSLTVFGADVIPKVAEIMHRKIILGFIDQVSSISNDALSAFLEFISYRVIEGWWNGHINVLFSAILKKIDNKPKHSNTFIMSCLYKLQQSNDIESLIILASEFIQSPVFSLLSADGNFFTAFLNILITPEVVDNPLSKSVWLLFEQTLQECDFVESIKEGKQLEYIQSSTTDTSRDAIKNILDQAISNSNHVQTQRINNSRFSRSTKITEFMKQCSSQAATVRRMMRYEFFYRLNSKSLDVDEAISRLFRANAREEQINNPSKRVMISSSTHPLCIPQKLVPCAFKYEVHCEKDSKLSKMMPRSHHFTKFNTTISELQIEQMAPQCLDGWHVPPFVPYGLAALAEEHFGVARKEEKDGENLFSCRLLNTPEPLPCVCAINDTSINFILYASMTDDDNHHQLVLQENSQLLCHYALIESAVRGFAGESSLFCNHPTLTIPFSSITVAVPRQFEYTDTAVDVFTASGTSMTIVFPENKRKQFINKVKISKKFLPVLGPCFSAHLLSIAPENVAKMWAKQQISTLEYLLYLNAKSGRSFNDFSQYPVFPWVISDYSSSDLPHSLRDLSKPMGMLTEPRAQKFREMYDETDPHYNYGTHYSYPAAVLYFMMRLEPFTLFNVMLHSGWDHKDRLFCDIQETWRGASGGNQADIKELIPQLYCVPAMFSNPNNLPLKARTDGHELSEVALPPWAKSSFDFVWKMRAALESLNVRQAISDWIDLVFGYKQRGQAAVEASNLFLPLSYGFTEVPPTQSDLDVINNFGQCPQQIFQQTPQPKSSAEESLTLQNSDVHTAQLKKLNADSERIVVREQEIVSLPKLCHKIGNLEFSVKDRYFMINGEQPQFDDSLFDVSDTAVSRDTSLISIASESGFILNYLIIQGSSTHFKLTTSCYYPGAAFKVIDCSTHLGVVCASTPTELFLYDLSTGLLMKKVETKDRITHIVIDDVHGLIIATGSHVCSVFTVNLELIGEHGSQTGITALAVGDSLQWVPKPFHITGHVDGSVCLWECDFEAMDEKTTMFNEKVLMRALSLPIASLSVFADGKAVVATDIEGEAVLCAASKSGVLLKPALFETCAICMQKLQSNAICCMYCGMPVCKNCRKTSKVCTACAATMEIPEEVETQEQEQQK